MKKMQKNIITFVMAAMLLVAIPGIALADQAGVVTKAQATAAVALFGRLKKANTYNILHYCKPCRDKVGKDEIVNKVEMKRYKGGNDDEWEVYVNDKSVDLAYIYYPIEAKHAQKKKGRNWKNFAMHLGIKVTDVPEYV